MKTNNLEYSPEGNITRIRLSDIYNIILFNDEEIQEMVKLLIEKLEE
jgi:hypothetical protein